MKRQTQDGTTERRLFPAEAFDGFGSSRFRPASEEIVGQSIRAGKGGSLLHGVKQHAPRSPGVYGMLDRSGRLIYIGKAKNLRVRLMSYFRVNSRDPKAGRILGQTRCLVWEQTADEFSALLRELELIQRFRPRFNVLGQPGMSRYHYVCLGKSPAPYVYLAKQPTGKELGCYGPLVSRDWSADAVRRLNDWFKLRDCPRTVALAFADQPEMFPEDRSPGCMRHELETCFGPCVRGCSRGEYTDAVRSAKAFLDGRDKRLLDELRKKMEAASTDFAFERALAMRDRLTSLQRLDDRLTLLRKARHRNSFVYPLVGHDGRERWYLIHRGQVCAVLPTPKSTADRHRAGTALRAAFSDGPAEAATNVKTVDSVLLVAAWFRKNEGDKDGLLNRAEAMKVCGLVEDPARRGESQTV